MYRVKDARIASVLKYLKYSALGHFAWEIGQLPLYTIFWNAPAHQTAFAVIHCTLGDILIAGSAFALAWMSSGRTGWPSSRTVFIRVAAVAAILGVAYTIFSEWLNTTVRHSWAYMPAMPVIPGVEVGLTPVLQWIIVPAVAFALTARYGADSRAPSGADSP